MPFISRHLLSYLYTDYPIRPTHELYEIGQGHTHNLKSWVNWKRKMPLVPRRTPELKDYRQCHSEKGKILRLMNRDNAIHIRASTQINWTRTMPFKSGQPPDLIEHGRCHSYQGKTSQFKEYRRCHSYRGISWVTCIRTIPLGLLMSYKKLDKAIHIRLKSWVNWIRTMPFIPLLIPELRNTENANQVRANSCVK